VVASVVVAASLLLSVVSSEEPQAVSTSSARRVINKKNNFWDFIFSSFLYFILHTTCWAKFLFASDWWSEQGKAG
jgi:hypothetical protein